MRLHPLLAVVGLSAVALAGCGGSGDAAPPIVTGVPGTGLTAATTEGAGGSPTGSAPGTTAGTIPAEPTLTEGSTISTVGLDRVTFGMTVEEAEAALGARLVAEEPKNPSCYVARPDEGADGVTFLVSDGRIERADVTAGKVGTRSGARISSTVADVNALYPGQIETQARPDGQPGSWLVFVPKDEADAKFRIVFVTDGTTVTAIRAGRLPQVLAPTGCA